MSVCPMCKTSNITETDEGYIVCDTCGHQLRGINRIDNSIQEGQYASGRRLRVSKRTADSSRSAAPQQISYEEGVQRILIFQLEQLIQNFNINPSIIDVVGSLWFKYLTQLLTGEPQKSPKKRRREQPKRSAASGTNASGNTNQADGDPPFEVLDSEIREEEEEAEGRHDDPNSVPTTVTVQANETDGQQQEDVVEEDIEIADVALDSIISQLTQSQTQTQLVEEEDFPQTPSRNFADADSDSESNAFRPMSNLELSQMAALRQSELANTPLAALSLSSAAISSVRLAEEKERRKQERRKSSSSQQVDDGWTTKPTPNSNIPRLLERKRPTIYLTLCFIYLGCAFLREPILVHDLIRWVKSGKLPFMTAYKILPLKKKSLLQPTQIPSTSAIIQQCFELADRLDLNLPPLNAPLFVNRFFNELSFPAMLTPCCVKLLSHASVNIYPTDLECATMLMAYVVVTMKLALGFDDIKRPFCADDSFYSYFPYESLLAWLKERVELLNKATSTRIPWAEKELFEMSGDSIKEYSEFCKKEAFARFNTYDQVRELVQIFENLDADTSMSDRGDDEDTYPPPAKRARTLDSDDDNESSSEEGSDSKQAKNKDSSPKKSKQRIPSKEYVAYAPGKRHSGVFHKSYDILLRLCARHIDESPERLHKCVRLVEKFLL